MTQQQEHQLPTWVVDLAILAAVFVIFVMKLLVYNGQLEIRAAALTTADIIGIILSIGGIVIGLIIYGYQNKQGKEIHKQGEGIAKVIQRVDAQTRSITETLAEIRRIDNEARARDNRRRDHHLFHIRHELTRLRDRVTRRIDLIQQLIIQNPDATLEQWDHQREQVEIRERAQTEAAMEIVRTHFQAIDDLIADPRLPVDLNQDLWNIADSLAVIHDLTDPIRDDRDRNDLLSSIRELRTEMLPRLNTDLQRLERENAPV